MKIIAFTLIIFFGCTSNKKTLDDQIPAFQKTYQNKYSDFAKKYSEESDSLIKRQMVAAFNAWTIKFVYDTVKYFDNWVGRFLFNMRLSESAISPEIADVKGFATNYVTTTMKRDPNHVFEQVEKLEPDSLILFSGPADLSYPHDTLGRVFPNDTICRVSIPVEIEHIEILKRN